MLDSASPEILVMADLDAVLKATKRELLIVKQKKDKKDFTKIYGGELRYMVNSLALSWDECALLMLLALYIDYDTNIVLSPNVSFDKKGQRTKNVVPASISEIVEISQRDRKTVLKTMKALETKGLIEVHITPRGKTRFKLIKLNPRVIFKGGHKKEVIERVSS